MKRTKGKWEVIYNHQKEDSNKRCIGVGVVLNINTDSEYVDFACFSCVPKTDKEYLAEKEQIEANMKLIAAAPHMLLVLRLLSATCSAGSERTLARQKGYIDEAIKKATL